MPTKRRSDEPGPPSFTKGGALMHPDKRTVRGDPYWLTQADADAALAAFDDSELAAWIARHRRKWLPTAESQCTIALSRDELRRVEAVLGHPLEPFVSEAPFTA